MIKHKEIRIVEEDLVVGDEPTVAEIKFGHGYDNFQFPLTVSFVVMGNMRLKLKENGQRLSELNR